MRFIALSKGGKATEEYVPSAEDISGMGNYIEQAMSADWLLATEGLHPSAKAARVKVDGGNSTVTDGPFTESKELIASYALIQVSSKQEAIDRSNEFLSLIGGGEVELWQIYEPSDFA
jgi:hypothetical protein